MTKEQLIVLGLLAVAFVVGWVARGVGGAAGRRERADEPTPRPSRKALATNANAVRIDPRDQWVDAPPMDLLVDETSSALNRTIEGYHAAVSASLRRGLSSPADVQPLAEEVGHLARLVERLPARLEPYHPLAGSLWRAAAVLPQIRPQLVSAPEPDDEVLDRLEEALATVAQAVSTLP